MEVLHIEPLIHTAGVEQELVGGDGEQGPGQFPDARLVEVLQVLTGQDQGGFLFTDTLETVTDISYRRGIGEPEVQLVDGR